jgi:hypothetical protein
MCKQWWENTKYLKIYDGNTGRPKRSYNDRHKLYLEEKSDEFQFGVKQQGKVISHGLNCYCQIKMLVSILHTHRNKLNCKKYKTLFWQPCVNRGLIK